MAESPDEVEQANAPRLASPPPGVQALPSAQESAAQEEVPPPPITGVPAAPPPITGVPTAPPPPTAPATAPPPPAAPMATSAFAPPAVAPPEALDPTAQAPTATPSTTDAQPAAAATPATETPSAPVESAAASPATDDTPADDGDVEPAAATAALATQTPPTAAPSAATTDTNVEPAAPAPPTEPSEEPAADEGTPPTRVTPQVAPPAAPPATATPTKPVGLPWVIEIWTDPDWYALQQSEESMPALTEPGVVVLQGSNILVGRPSRSRGIRPQVDCGADTGVSRRHCELTTDGTKWWVTDLGSANGTFVRHPGGELPLTPVPPGERRSLEDGSCIYVGAWTRLLIRTAQPVSA